jgi:hypothetical protein
MIWLIVGVTGGAILVVVTIAGAALMGMSVKGRQPEP